MCVCVRVRLCACGVVTPSRYFITCSSQDFALIWIWFLIFIFYRPFYLIFHYISCNIKRNRSSQILVEFWSQEKLTVTDIKNCNAWHSMTAKNYSSNCRRSYLVTSSYTINYNRYVLYELWIVYPTQQIARYNAIRFHLSLSLLLLHFYTCITQFSERNCSDNLLPSFSIKYAINQSVRENVIMASASIFVTPFT